MSKQLDMAVGDVNSDKKGSGARANKGKVAMSLAPYHLLAGAGRVFMGGKLKYAAWNWAKGMPWSVPLDCVYRHLSKWFWLGEDIDEESGEHHLDCAICNLLMLRHYVNTFKEGDDRPPQDVTHFAEAFDDFVKTFDEEDFLNRNPEIKEKVDNERGLH